jgi:endonuclease YncB( thermonuclease family)
MKILFALALLFLTCFSAYAETLNFKGSLISVTEGDEIDVTIEDEDYTISLIGIDAPEPDQRLYIESQSYLRRLLGSGRLKGISFRQVDNNGNLLMYVFNSSGRDVGLAMIEAGMALPYTKTNSGQNYMSAEKALAYRAAGARAKSRKLGLWRLPDTVSPFCGRHPSNSKCRADKTSQPN